MEVAQVGLTPASDEAQTENAVKEAGRPFGMEALLAEGVEAFQSRMRTLAAPLWRELPWRGVDDPYLVWISEVMLQQTQVVRVQGRWADWLERFPGVQALAQAPQAEVLRPGRAWGTTGGRSRFTAVPRPWSSSSTASGPTA